MKTQVEKVSTLGRKLSVEVPVSLVKSTMERYFQKVQQEANLKGFRKGKAPLSMIRGMYSDRIKNDVVQDLIQQGYSKGLQEHSLSPVDYPEFEVDEFSEDKDFSFTANFEIPPEVELKKYEGLDIEKKIYSVDPTELDKILANIQKSRATSEEVTESRAAQLEDIAVIDFVGTVDGKPLEGGAGTDHPLELGSKSFIEGFESGIVGMNVGDVKTLQLQFPENYHADLSGKKVDFEVTLKSLRKKVLPELNDEFIQSLQGGKGSLEELKSNILKDIEQRQNKKTEDTLKEALLKQLASLNPVEIPNSLVQQQKKLLVDDTEQQMTKEGMSPQEFEAYKAKWDSNFEDTAKTMIHVAYLIDAIASKLNLHCTKEDVDNKFAEYAQQTGIAVERVKEHYSKAESMNRMVHKITDEKVTAYLLSKSNIKEVPAE